VSIPAPLHQAGLVEWVAAVFALAAAGEQFVCCEPLADDLRVAPDCSDGPDGYLNVSSGGITVGMCGLPVFDEGHRLMADCADSKIILNTGI
jgi:hypothetical protein